MCLLWTLQRMNSFWLSSVFKALGYTVAIRGLVLYQENIMYMILRPTSCLSDLLGYEPIFTSDIAVVARYSEQCNGCKAYMLDSLKEIESIDVTYATSIKEEKSKEDVKPKKALKQK